MLKQIAVVFGLATGAANASMINTFEAIHEVVPINQAGCAQSFAPKAACIMFTGEGQDGLTIGTYHANPGVDKVLAEYFQTVPTLNNVDIFGEGTFQLEIPKSPYSVDKWSGVVERGETCHLGSTGLHSMPNCFREADIKQPMPSPAAWLLILSGLPLLYRKQNKNLDVNNDIT